MPSGRLRWVAGPRRRTRARALLRVTAGGGGVPPQGQSNEHTSGDVRHGGAPALWRPHGRIHPSNERAAGGVMGAIPVYLEQGRSRTFAVALDWPGWARSGKGDEGALDALAAYAVRFLPVARRTGLPVDFAADDVTFEVVERVPGTPTTDFGAIDVVLARDADPVTAQEGERLARCVEAA